MVLFKQADLQISFRKKCKSGGSDLTRLKLKDWMKMVSWSRLYFCHDCQESMHKPRYCLDDEGVWRRYSVVIV